MPALLGKSSVCSRRSFGGKSTTSQHTPSSCEDKELYRSQNHNRPEDTTLATGCRQELWGSGCSEMFGMPFGRSCLQCLQVCPPVLGWISVGSCVQLAESRCLWEEKRRGKSSYKLRRVASGQAALLEL